MKVTLYTLCLIALFLGAAPLPAQAESHRESVCKQSANIFLRIRANVDDSTGAVSYSCACVIPPDQYNQYMSYCMHSFSDQNINEVEQDLRNSACANYRYQACVP